VSGDVLHCETGDKDNFLQCGEFFRSALDADAHEHWTDNIAGQIACAQEFIREWAFANFTCADVDYGRMIRDKVKGISAGRKKSCQCIIEAPLSPPRIVPAPVLALALVDSCRSVKSIGWCLYDYWWITVGSRSLYFKWIVLRDHFCFFSLLFDGSRPLSRSSRNKWFDSVRSSTVVPSWVEISLFILPLSKPSDCRVGKWALIAW
jgi:hypothetical protein